jgi:TetR/AcrR family transcriptional repressor of mexJK operon
MLAPQRSHVGVEETRARILAAAREIFEVHGTRGTTTREVAIRAGVNEATLFRHFGSKAALIAAMREDACGLEVFRSVISGLTGEDIAADLKKLSASSVDNMTLRRRLMLISMAEDAVYGTGDDPDSPEWRGPKQMLELLTEYFEARLAEGRIAGNPRTLARVLMGMMMQLVVARKIWVGEVIDQTTVDLLVDVFLNGVRT